LRKSLPEWCIINNPLDLTGNALSYPNHYADVLDEIHGDGSVDIVLLIYGDPIQGSFKSVQASLEKAKSVGLPVAVCYLGGAEVQVEEVNKFQQYGVPVFDEPSKAIVALGYLNQNRVSLSRIKQ
jgi:acyl-CoA synthetase (NDP forming)